MNPGKFVYKPFKGFELQYILTCDLQGHFNLKDPCNDFWMSPPTGGRCCTGFLRAHRDMIKKSQIKFSSHIGVR